METGEDVAYFLLTIYNTDNFEDKYCEKYNEIAFNVLERITKNILELDIEQYNPEENSEYITFNDYSLDWEKIGNEVLGKDVSDI